MTTEGPLLSVVIPAYNRLDTLECTLAVLRRALARLDGPAEVIIVDDGSAQPLEPRLQGFEDLPIRWIRQENQGAVVAKQNGYLQARGRYVQFLDSDDLIHPDKFRVQVGVLEETGVDFVYGDGGSDELRADWDGSSTRQRLWKLAEVSTAREFFLQVQPGPHNVLARRSYLDKHLREPMIPPHRHYGAVGEIWIYFNLAIHPATFRKTPGHFSIAGRSESERLTDHWERMGVAANLLMESFAACCPRTPQTEPVLQELALRAFKSWRMLPKGMNPRYLARRRRVLDSLPEPPLARLGGGKFILLARLVGRYRAAEIYRAFRQPYSKIRTVSDEEMEQLLARPCPVTGKA